MAKHISGRYWNDLRIGLKKAEGRVESEFWNIDLMGQVLTFVSDNGQTFAGRIINIHTYNGTDVCDAFRQMLGAEGVQNMLPDIDTIDKGVEKYMTFVRPDNISCTVHAFFIFVL